MLMAVEVIDRNAGRPDAADLRVELAANLLHRPETAQPFREQLLQVRLERAVAPNEAGRRGRAAQRPLLSEHEMDADGETRAQSCELESVLERRPRGHDGRRRHDAVVV